MMHASSSAYALIKRYEGLRTTAYLCPAGVYTLGYGHTKGVGKGQTCTQAQAEIMLEQDVGEIEVNIVRALNAGEVEVTQSQFDALVSFVFNIGFNAFLGSTLLRRLEHGDIAGAADEFLRWNKAKVAGSYVVLAGLSKRRQAERALFLSD